jgi:magnesium-transporting ATPase (P-type)
MSFTQSIYALGDPTEAAFATLLMKAGFNPSAVSAEYPRLQLFPFDSVRKRVSILREHRGKRNCLCERFDRIASAAVHAPSGRRRMMHRWFSTRQ